MINPLFNNSRLDHPPSNNQNNNRPQPFNQVKLSKRIRNQQQLRTKSYFIFL
jgi:hypothetical protein